MELKQDTVDVDRWVDRHVGWHLVLFMLGACGGALVGYEAGKKWGGPEPAPESAKLRAVRDELGKLRAAYASADQRAKEWERRAMEKSE